jgi:hypothetical protein
MLAHILSETHCNCCSHAVRVWCVVEVTSSALHHALLASFLFIASSKASSPQSAINAFSFNFQYTLLSLRSSSTCFRLLPHLPLTSIFPFFFPSMTCFRKHFLREMWLIQLTFLFFVLRIILFSLALCNTLFFTGSV